MTNIDNMFFGNEFDKDKVSVITKKALKNCTDGELFLEYRQTEGFTLDDSHIRHASFDTTKGFGLRAVVGETTGYAHSNEITEESLKRAARTVQAVHSGNSGAVSLPIQSAPKKLYTDSNPLELIEFEKKIELLSKIDVYARSKDPKIKQVTVSLVGSWQAVNIIRPEISLSDIRPLVRMNVQIMAASKNRMETGSYGFGGRTTYDRFFKEENWKYAVDEALRQALVNLESVDAPAGEMPVILGNGWNGILLHEAIGHGLEGDFNRKKTSAFADKIGQQIASKGVTVVDDGTIPDRRGSLTIDDEGTPTQKTTLIEDGILTGYMYDRINAQIMGTKSTGNGRRESYACSPFPRMTNTFMLGGDKEPEELIKSVKKGVYAVHFGGGQVDITSGKFVFSASEAYMIENGKIGAPLKGATLIGSGSDVLTKISMIGNDMKLDDGIGTCGKEGQGVPVGVGQPSLKIDSITIGGTNV
ncbi:MAG: metalloprotease TldD [Alphaproteobacteria bacterium]|nr:metalloprotease TldD [Alphaproteobacteria bacterium]